MKEKLRGVVTSINLIKPIEPGLDLCELTIDFDCVKIFYSSTDLMQFLNQPVLYTTRRDVIDGIACQVICEIALVRTVQTVSSIENIKLIPEGKSRTVCNFSIADIRYGEYYPNCVAYMNGYKPGASAKARWFDCNMIDKDSKEFTVKIFARSADVTVDIETLGSAGIGKYVQFNLELTKYGYRTDDLYVLTNPVELSPEVEVAKAVIMNVINSDNGLTEYNMMTNFMNGVSSIIDGEPGYALVRIASEIFMINAIDSISNDLDIRAMKRAAICSRGYLLPHGTNWSRPLLNTNKVLKCKPLKEDKELLFILDVLSENEPSATKLTYLKVRRLVDDIIKIRRGVNDEEIISDYSSFVSMFNGLL